MTEATAGIDPLLLHHKRIKDAEEGNNPEVTLGMAASVTHPKTKDLDKG